MFASLLSNLLAGEHISCVCWLLSIVVMVLFLKTQTKFAFSITFQDQDSAGSRKILPEHYRDVIKTAMAFQVTCVSIVYSDVCSGANQRKHQSCASLVFVRGIQWWPMDYPQKGRVTRKIFPFDDVIMETRTCLSCMVITTTAGSPLHKTDKLQSQRGWIITSIIKYGVK